jgi:DNA-binding response OmpR family regulator
MPDPIPYLTDPTNKLHPLDKETMLIGRAVTSDIVITGKRVSREHARLRRQGHRTWIEDLGSTNGVLLNAERLLAETELHEGDEITIGEVTLTYHDPDTTFRDTLALDLELDLKAGVVRVNRRVVTLSPKEFSLLAHLYEHRNQVCSKDDIGRAVWPEYQDGIYDYQIENLVRRLRSRLEPDAAEAQLILTVRGLGYKLVAPQ